MVSVASSVFHRISPPRWNSICLACCGFALKDKCVQERPYSNEQKKPLLVDSSSIDSCSVLSVDQEVNLGPRFVASLPREIAFTSCYELNLIQKSTLEACVPRKLSLGGSAPEFLESGS